jgi:beta-phosphoglucomutase family hydrolase
MALGLPVVVRACLFDLDGVLTNTATLHAKAWKEVFDEFLRRHSAAGFRPFDIELDYARYVDGKPREDGVRDFLLGRGIILPEGHPDDDPAAETVHGLGNRKNRTFSRLIAQYGVEVFPGSERYLRAAQDAKLRRIVVSSSANAGLVLRATGLDQHIEGCVDGLTIAARHLRGKPHPDAFLAGAELAGVSPAQAAVFEDSLAGVMAGRAGEFGYVVGVDRLGQAQQLKYHGADIVVRDLAELLERPQ